MHDAVADDYCYPGTTILKNKLDLTDADELANFEAEVSDARVARGGIFARNPLRAKR
jgi:cell filamentation protein